MSQFCGLADKNVPPRILQAATLLKQWPIAGSCFVLVRNLFNIGAIKEGGCTSDRANGRKKGGIENMYRSDAGRTVLRYIFALLRAFVGQNASYSWLFPLFSPDLHGG